jgi:hypothetical protein
MTAQDKNEELFQLPPIFGPFHFLALATTEAEAALI